MANFGTREVNRGSITFSPAYLGVATVFFVPTTQTLQYLRLPQGKTIEPVKLLEFDGAQNRANIYPINTLPTQSSFALPKYRHVRVISLPLDSSELPA